MSKETGGAVVIVIGTLAVIMAVRGSWENVWKALTGKRQSASNASVASQRITFGPGGVVGDLPATGGGGGGGLPGSPPVPLPPGGQGRSYDALVRGNLRFAGVDQGIDFTGPGQILAPVAGVVERAQRGGSGWPGEGSFELVHLQTGRHLYVAEDFTPTVSKGARVERGQVIGIASGSGKAPGIELGFADAAGHPLSPLYPGPHDPKPWGRAFNDWVLGLSRAGVQGSGEIV